MVRLKAPDDVVSTTINDTTYQVGADGHVEVENTDHLPTLRLHGYGDGDPVVERDAKPDFASMTREKICEWLADKAGVAIATNTGKPRLLDVAEETWAKLHPEHPQLLLEPPVVANEEPPVVEETDEEREAREAAEAEAETE